MGGIGCGRSLAGSKRTTMEDTLKIDIGALKRMGLFREGQAGALWWTRNGEETGQVDYVTQKHGIALNYRYRAGGGDWESVSLTIAYGITPCHFGGVRHWLVCPSCKRNVGVLAADSKLFLCRYCYELPYASQSESPIDRMIRRREKIGKRIFAQNGDQVYLRRKGLHKRTYERELNHYHELEWAIDNWISVKLNALDGLI